MALALASSACTTMTCRVHFPAANSFASRPTRLTLPHVSSVVGFTGDATRSGVSVFCCSPSHFTTIASSIADSCYRDSQCQTPITVTADVDSSSSSPLGGVIVGEGSGSYSTSSIGGDVVVSRRDSLVQFLATGILSNGLACFFLEVSPAVAAGGSDGGSSSQVENRPKFYDLGGSGGVMALDIREGTGATPQIGDKVAIHYYARLAAKQGWRFDSSYDHKDQSGAPEPYVFVIGDGTVIAGLDNAVRTMKEGGVRRVVIPPSQGYQNMIQGPVPPNFSDRQRLYTTIFNPTRLANGEGSTLGILVFDIELLGIRPA